jgi:hypothetical protein|nr:MAG TPA: tail sheath protein [Caudoviricetes sp.]
MALGGGTFQTQNKVLPGAYINFVSINRASAVLSDRGTVAVPLSLDWGPEGEVFEVEGSDFYKNSENIFGYGYSELKMRNLRELFKHTKKAVCYRLGIDGVKASNVYAEAKYPGVRGNDITISVQSSIDNEGYSIVKTLLDGKVKDTQTVQNANDLKENDWVVFKAQESLAVTSGAALSGGKNSTTTGEDYQSFLNKLETYSFNILCCTSNDDLTKGLFTAFTKRMREDVGVKFQTVLYKYESADDIGVISVENKVTNADADEQDLVYWVSGAEAECMVNRSLSNMEYDGELSVNVEYTQNQLIDALNGGKFIFHRSNNLVRVLSDINTLVNTTQTTGKDFKDNQTVRIADQIANDVAVLFGEKYYGKINNDESGRIALKSDILYILKALFELGALESVGDDAIVVNQGESKKSVAVDMSINTISAIGQLYMQVNVG